MQGSVFDRFPKPPCAETLGWRLIEAGPDRVRIEFEGRREFCNPAGFIQGGFLTAMLDDLMGPAVLVASGGELFTVTTSMNVSFLAPARPGPLTGEGRVVQLGRTIGFVEAQLWAADGTEVARASASARLMAVTTLPQVSTASEPTR